MGDQSICCGKRERIFLFLVIFLSSSIFPFFLDIDGGRKDRLVGIVPCEFVFFRHFILFCNDTLLLIMFVTGSNGTGNFRDMVSIMLSMLQLWQAVGIRDALVPLGFEVVQSFVGGTFDGNCETAREGGRRQGEGRAGQNRLAYRFESGHRGRYSGPEHDWICVDIDNICDSTSCVLLALGCRRERHIEEDRREIEK